MENKIPWYLRLARRYLSTPEQMTAEDHFKKHLAEDVFVPLSEGVITKIGDRLVSLRDGEYFSRGFMDQGFEMSKGAKLFLQVDVSESPSNIPDGSIVGSTEPIFVYTEKVTRGDTDEGHKFVEFQGTRIESLDTSGEIWPAKETIDLNQLILKDTKS